MISGLMIASGSRRLVARRRRAYRATATKMRQPFVHLRRRQADAVVLDHRVDHVVDQLLNGALPDLARVRAAAPWRAAPDGPCARLSEWTYPANYTAPLKAAAVRPSWRVHPVTHDVARLPVLSALRRRARAAAAEGHRARAARSARAAASSSISIRRSPSARSSATDERPARAGAARDRAGLRQVGVSRRLRRSRRTADRRPRSAKRARNAASTSGSTASSTSTRIPAARRSSSSTRRPRSAARCACDEECLETAEFDSAAIPWDDLAFRSTHEGLRDYLAGLLHPVRT